MMEILIICLPRPYLCLEHIELYSHTFVALGACIAVLAVLHVWVSSGSSPEVCGHFALLHVYNRHMYETFPRPKHTERDSLSMVAYLVSTSVSVLLANAMGLLFWMSAVLMPYSLALVCRIMGCVQS